MFFLSFASNKSVIYSYIDRPFVRFLLLCRLLLSNNRLQKKQNVHASKNNIFYRSVMFLLQSI